MAAPAHAPPLHIIPGMAAPGPPGIRRANPHSEGVVWDTCPGPSLGHLPRGGGEGEVGGEGRPGVQRGRSLQGKYPVPEGGGCRVSRGDCRVGRGGGERRAVQGRSGCRRAQGKAPRGGSFTMGVTGSVVLDINTG